MTSTVPAAKGSRDLLLSDLLPGRSNVGPNTVARLWRDILFWASCWFTLKKIKKIKRDCNDNLNLNFGAANSILCSTFHRRSERKGAFYLR